MAFKVALALVSVLACVAGGLAARASHPAEHVIANQPLVHAASQPAASYSLAAAQVGEVADTSRDAPKKRAC